MLTNALLSDDFWITAAQYSIPAFLAVVGVWIQGRATNKKVEKVRELAEPTGNGFAKDVKQGLADLKSGMDQLSTKIELTNEHLFRHLETHLTMGGYPGPQTPGNLAPPTQNEDHGQ